MAGRPQNLTPDQALSLADATYVDVRTAQEFSFDIGRIEGAVNVPLQDMATSGFPAELLKAKHLVIVCRSGARSGQAAAMLAPHAEGTVYNLMGGMAMWARLGLPMER
jgi:rhodanese-related sulfurtransferase